MSEPSKELRRAIVAQAAANKAVRIALGEEAVEHGEITLGTLLEAAGESQLAETLFERYWGEARFRTLNTKYFDAIVDAAVFVLLHPASPDYNVVFLNKVLEVCAECTHPESKADFYALHSFEKTVGELQRKREVEQFISTLAE